MKIMLAGFIAAIASLQAFGQDELELLPLTMPEQKVAALTFDDGPNPETTPQILQELEKRHVRATFFVAGRLAAAHPQILKRMANDGDEIANHTYNHPNLPACSSDRINRELALTSEAIEKAAGKRPVLMRPPSGATNTRVMDLTARAGLKTVIWSLNPEDWKYRNSARTINFVLDRVRSGDVVLLHDIHATTAAAVPQILDGLIKRGYKLVTVSEMLALDRDLAAQNDLPWLKQAQSSFPGQFSRSANALAKK